MEDLTYTIVKQVYLIKEHKCEKEVRKERGVRSENKQKRGERHRKREKGEEI